MSVGWGLDCIDGEEVELWGECYNIEETTELNLYKLFVEYYNTPPTTQLQHHQHNSVPTQHS